MSLRLSLILTLVVVELCTPILSMLHGHTSPTVCVASLNISLPEDCINPPAEEHRQNHTLCMEPTVSIPICRETMNVTVIKLRPFSDSLVSVLLLRLIYPACCGKCAAFNVVNNFASNEEFLTGVPSAAFNDSNVILPIFGDFKSMLWHGYHFLPLFELSDAYLITLPQDSSGVMSSLLAGIYTLWPLLLICLLMAACAGFVGWLFETWNNAEEFRRPFFQGLFDGFWWSFVSMTTVGYGDKSPKSVSARLFSVVWILCGITICSMFTASLTNVITSVAVPPEPEINGNKIGVLGDRLYDFAFVVKLGGFPIKAANIEELIELLAGDEVYGILLDSYTYKALFKFPNPVKKTLITMSGATYGYGVGFTRQEDFIFFSNVMADNKLLVQTCLNLNMKEDKDAVSTSIFDPDSGLFYPFFTSSLCMVIVICICGAIYEIRRKSKRQIEDGAKGDEPVHQENSPIEVKHQNNEGFNGNENNAPTTNYSTS